MNKMPWKVWKKKLFRPGKVWKTRVGILYEPWAQMSICFSDSPSLCFILFCCYSVYVVLHSWLNILIDTNSYKIWSDQWAKQSTSVYSTETVSKNRQKVYATKCHLLLKSATQHVQKCSTREYCTARKAYDTTTHRLLIDNYVYWYRRLIWC